MDRGICVADNAIATISSMKQCLCSLFSFQKCWSNSLSLFAVSDSTSGNVNKKWSSLEAVGGFKVKDRYPSKSVQRNSIRKSVRRNSTRDFWKCWWGPALLWLVRSRFELVDFHLNLCGGTQRESSKKYDGYLFCYCLSNLDLMVECNDHILPTGKHPCTLTQVSACWSLLKINCAPYLKSIV